MGKESFNVSTLQLFNSICHLILHKLLEENMLVFVFMSSIKMIMIATSVQHMFKIAEDTQREYFPSQEHRNG